MNPATASFSLNDRAAALADALTADAAVLRLGVDRGAGGETRIDCGHACPGGTDVGLHLARICLGGLADVAVVPSAVPTLSWDVTVRTSQPVLACLGSQYAGWHLRTAKGTSLLGSGPARALARQESLFTDLPHRETASHAVLVLEGECAPDDALAAEVAGACGLPQNALTLLHSPTGSLAGCAQIAARAIECALQKARHLGIPLEGVVEAVGQAPLARPHPDPRVAMGRANDAIIYGGRVEIVLEAPPEDAHALANALPSSTAPEWGQSFAAVFERAAGNFARVDPALFSPAEVVVTTLTTGDTFRAGERDPARLNVFLSAS